MIRGFTARHASRALGRGSRILTRTSLWLDRSSKKLVPPPVVTVPFPAKLNFGCGQDKHEGYLNVDIDPACHPDLLIVDGDDTTLPRRYFSEVMALDVLEHFPRAQTLDALLNFADYLADRGTLILKTTSILHVADELRLKQTFADHYGWTTCLFGNQAHPGDFHYTGFTELTLRTQLLAAEFGIEEFGLSEEWMFYVKAKKVADWASLSDASNGLDDQQFLERAYQAAFYRKPDGAGIAHYGEQLRCGVPRKRVLKELFASLERLYRVAERNKI